MLNRTQLFTFLFCAVLITGCDWLDDVESDSDGQAPAMADLHASSSDQRALRKSNIKNKNRADHNQDDTHEAYDDYDCYSEIGGEERSLSNLLAETKQNTFGQFDARSDQLFHVINRLSSDTSMHHVMQTLADQDWAIVADPGDPAEDDFNAYVWSNPDCPNRIIFTDEINTIDEHEYNRPDLKISMTVAEEVFTAHIRDHYDLHPVTFIQTIMKQMMDQDDKNDPSVRPETGDHPPHTDDRLNITPSPMEARAIRHMIEGITISLASMEMHDILSPVNKKNEGNEERDAGAVYAPAQPLTDWQVLKNIRPDIHPVLQTVEDARDHGKNDARVFKHAMDAYPRTQRAMDYDAVYLSRAKDEFAPLIEPGVNGIEHGTDGNDHASNPDDSDMPPILTTIMLPGSVQVTVQWPIPPSIDFRGGKNEISGNAHDIVPGSKIPEVDAQPYRPVNDNINHNLSSQPDIHRHITTGFITDPDENDGGHIYFAENERLMVDRDRLPKRMEKISFMDAMRHVMADLKTINVDPDSSHNLPDRLYKNYFGPMGPQAPYLYPAEDGDQYEIFNVFLSMEEDFYQTNSDMAAGFGWIYDAFVKSAACNLGWGN